MRIMKQHQILEQLDIVSKMSDTEISDNAEIIRKLTAKTFELIVKKSQILQRENK